MDEIKRITPSKITEIVAKCGFRTDLMLKDYYVTVILYLIKDIEGIYFKGGTALQKIFLNYSRISEDIDLTLTREVSEVIKDIEEAISKSRLFGKITKDKDVEGFTRLIAHYKDFEDKETAIFIDLNKRAKLLIQPESHKIEHFYKDDIPEFSFNTLAEKEMIAEKVAAAIGRNRPRDHFDIYKIISKKIPIDLGLVKKKCEQSGNEFSIIKMFNNAKKLKNRWDEGILPFLVEEVSFQYVMKTLADYFKLKKEKIRADGKHK